MTTEPRKLHLLNREQASRYLIEVWSLKRTPQTLTVFAVTPGRGPNFVKVGYNALYSPDDLDEWVRSITRPPEKKAWSGVTTDLAWVNGKTEAKASTTKSPVPKQSQSMRRKRRSRPASTGATA